MMGADMPDSVKQKELIPCPCFLGGFSFHMQGISDFKFLLSMWTREWFLNYQDVQWIY
jgi:hypothetical protein